MTGGVVWFTGLPASGKSTLARRVREALAPRAAILLDGDDVRDALGFADYDAAGRSAFYHALAALAVLLARQGHVVLVAATAPLRAHRDLARAAPRFVEVYLRTPRDQCEGRDAKGLYARARAGLLPTLPGVGAAYEPPERPDVVAGGGEDPDAPAAIAARLR